MALRTLWTKVRFLLEVPARSRSPTGRGSRLRPCTLWVRIPPRLPCVDLGIGAMPRDVDRLVSASCPAVGSTLLYLVHANPAKGPGSRGFNSLRAGVRCVAQW